MFKNFKRKYHLHLATKALEKEIKGKKNLFFFPYFHIGGGEMVHKDILSVFDKKDILCFITETSKNDALKTQFSNNATLFEFDKHHLKHRYKNKFAKKIAELANKNNIEVVFGCNTLEFYSCIPYLSESIKVIDLFHAFTFDNPKSLEKITLDKLKYIDQRIVLGEKTKIDFKLLYAENDINTSELNKIKIIKNKVNSPTQEFTKQKNKILKLLFVGRDSEEKRAHLFIDIINHCKKEGIAINATMIGDFSRLQSKNLGSTPIDFPGEIYDKNIINSHYFKNDIILLTSTREGLPMVILEAMSNQVVTISTNVGEISEIVTPDTGFLIDNTINEDEMVKSFVDTIKLLDTNRSKLEILQKNAKKTVLEKYSETQFNKAYKSLIKK